VSCNAKGRCCRNRAFRASLPVERQALESTETYSSALDTSTNVDRPTGFEFDSSPFEKFLPFAGSESLCRRPYKTGETLDRSQLWASGRLLRLLMRAPLVTKKNLRARTLEFVVGSRKRNTLQQARINSALCQVRCHERSERVVQGEAMLHSLSLVRHDQSLLEQRSTRSDLQAESVWNRLPNKSQLSLTWLWTSISTSTLRLRF
jgi:hypothetical protein